MFDVVSLAALGFTGFVPFDKLPSADVPNVSGVYVIIRVSDAPVLFLDASPAGYRNGRSPSVPLTRLTSKWVPTATVVYIGKADIGERGRRGLAKRLDEYREHGAGKEAQHWGGRFIWQLADHAELLVAWKPTPDQDPEDAESALINEFIATHGRLPFANLKVGRRAGR